MRVLQSRSEHLYIWYVCLSKVSLPCLRALTGQILKPFTEYASITSTKEWEILEDNLCMMEGPFYTWKHLYTFLLLDFPHYFQVRERTAKVVLHHFIVNSYAEFKGVGSAETSLAGSSSLAAQTCSGSTGICCLLLPSSWDVFLIHGRVANFQGKQGQI